MRGTALTTTTEAWALPGRDVRRLVLEDLAEVQLDGIPVDERPLALILSTAGSRSWTRAQLLAKFAVLVAETERLRAVRAFEPGYRALDPATCESDRQAVLADLLDGTGTYEGSR